MAKSIIKRRGVGEGINITLPYTAPTDGYFYMQLNPNSTAAAYLYCQISGTRVSAISTAGARATNTYLVKKGERITQERVTGANEYNFRFIPIYF